MEDDITAFLATLPEIPNIRIAERVHRNNSNLAHAHYLSAGEPIPVAASPQLTYYFNGQKEGRYITHVLGRVGLDLVVTNAALDHSVAEKPRARPCSIVSLVSTTPTTTGIYARLENSSN